MYTKTANKLFIDISHIVLLTEQANRFFWLPMVYSIIMVVAGNVNNSFGIERYKFTLSLI